MSTDPSDRVQAASVVIALIGAESTGKTTLAHELTRQLAAPGRRVARVDEVLREFCLREGRTPRRDEQAAIAREQSHRIAEAARRHDIVVADTTALMIAIYSQLLFDDETLLAGALADQARCRLTLLTALDLPWVADGIMRDGAHVRAPVDALLRKALHRVGVGYSVVAGSGAQRLAHAERAVAAALRPAAPAAPRWRAVCAECGDPDCERHLLAGRGVS
ncbi:MAG TPA: ATP-binding protein [Burkholderiaceae bacterium]|nr:ATP-binding protein [Burkholderiaceae bacterium]